MVTYCGKTIQVKVQEVNVCWNEFLWGHAHVANTLTLTASVKSVMTTILSENLRHSEDTFIRISGKRMKAKHWIA